jgi:hypothetical protein
MELAVALIMAPIFLWDPEVEDPEVEEERIWMEK